MKPLQIIAALSLVLASQASPAFFDKAPTFNAEIKAGIERINTNQKGGKGTVLVVISSADSIPIANGKTHKTGYFLRELTDPLKEVI